MDLISVQSYSMSGEETEKTIASPDFKSSQHWNGRCWASVSKPHTSEFKAAFPLYYHGTYIIPYILCLPNLAHCNPISMLISFNVLDCDHVA